MFRARTQTVPFQTVQKGCRLRFFHREREDAYQSVCNRRARRAERAQDVPLSAVLRLPFAPKTYGHTKRKAGLTLPFFWCARRESNPEPTASEAVTLSNCATDTRAALCRRLCLSL